MRAKGGSQRMLDLPEILLICFLTALQNLFFFNTYPAGSHERLSLAGDCFSDPCLDS
jgi:hypothetical protein